MDRSPGVSILMPVYNAADFLKECLDSIIIQSFSNWELIAVDDFSSDDSHALLNHYALKDNRIKVFRNRAKGIIPALRLAFNQCKGQMITRMDADDIMPLSKLQLLSENLQALGKGHVISGKVKYFSTTELNEGFKKYEVWINSMDYCKRIYEECTLPSACWMAFYSDLLSIKAFEESKYPEDYDLLFKLYKHKFKISGVDAILHLWRDHPSRASRTNKHYADQNYFSLKVPYFLDIDYNPDVPLFVWGAGRKGKDLAKELIRRQVSFTWVSDNVKKLGKDIYGVKITSPEAFLKAVEKQVIVVISDKNFAVEKQGWYEKYNIADNQRFEFAR